MIEISLLGPLEVRRDGALVAVPAGKSTEVLARLALDAGHPVRAELIIEDVWHGATDTGKNTLQSKVSQLRRAMGDPQSILNRHGTYTLDLPADAVDALRVSGLASSASTLRASGDLAAALEIATEGLALFRGEPLGDTGDGAWLEPHRARLAEVRLGLLEDQLAARVTLGGGGDVVGELERLVSAHPLREGLWQTLITALYRQGRQADALDAYARVRQVLGDELGLDPGPALRELERQVLQHSPALDQAVRPGTAVPVGNLPRVSSPLVGRIDDQAAVRDLLGDHRLVTVVGPAGVGKTRLAVEVARAAEPVGGSWLVRLDAADASTSLGQVVAEALQLASEDMLLDRVLGVELLLLIDNCEHVVDAAANLVDRLLDETTQLRILATSQVPLGLAGERTFVVEPLPIDDSVQLFAQRASEIRSRFELDDDAARTVEEVCQALDRLPLAIELAAARVKSLSVQEIARRLDDRFTIVRDPTSRRADRRRTLAGAIAWSYDLLFPDDQLGLCALSCFVAGAPLAAAEHVLGELGVPSESALDVVGRLVDRSLVELEIAESGSVRYRLLDSIRAFALARLAETGRADLAFAAHAAWYADRAEALAAKVRTSAQPDCVEFVRRERANVDAALAWSAAHAPAVGLRIALGLGWTWVVLGDGVTGAQRVRDAWSAGADLAGARDRIRALLLTGWLEASAGDVHRAEVDLDQAFELARAIEDDHLVADAQRHLAFAHLMQGRPPDARTRAQESLQFYRAQAMEWDVAGSLLLGASASWMLADTARATDAAREAVRILEPIGDDWGLVHAEAMLGAIAQAEHRFDEAAEHLANAATSSGRLGFAGQAAYHLTKLGRVQHQSGANAEALRTLDQAIEAATACGDLRMAATAGLNLARVLRTIGDPVRARATLEQINAWYDRSGGGDGALLGRFLLAVLSDSLVPAEAATQVGALLDEAERGGDLEVQVLALDRLARLAAERGDRAEAADLLESSDRRLPVAIQVVDAVDRVDAHIARARLATV